MPGKNDTSSKPVEGATIEVRTTLDVYERTEGGAIRKIGTAEDLAMHRRRAESSDAPRGATIETDRAREITKAWVFWRDAGVEIAELADLLAWVRARMATEVRSRAAFREYHEEANDGEGDGLPDNDREAIAHAVMLDLGLEGPDGEHGTAWTLCERAGWPGLTTEQARAEAQAWAEWRRWADRRKAAGDYEAEFEGDWDPHDDERGAALDAWVRARMASTLDENPDMRGSEHVRGWLLSYVWHDLPDTRCSEIQALCERAGWPS